jgi:VWFA-related protein
VIASRRRFLIGALPAVRLFAQKDTTFTTGVKVVNVFATVRNTQGQIVRDLAKDDFRLDEDGQPQIISYFSQESNLPLTLGLLIDTSGSQRRLIGQERTASYRFLEQVLREDKDHGFVIHFDREVELLQDVTSSRRKLEASLDLLDSPSRGVGYPRGGGTALYDAVLLASEELMKKQTGRKALIVLSDGVDIGSKVNLGRAIEAAQRADTLSYSILFADEQAYGSPNRGRYGGSRGRYGGGGPARMPQDRGAFGKQVLQRLSRETGAGFFEVSRKHPIERVFSEIEDELRSQYNLGYTSDRKEAPAGFRTIHVAAKDPNLTVQSRDGYYPE